MALPLSVLLLARDEREALERLLPALAFAGEVVVVSDTRGEPGIKALAARHGARVFERPFDGFGPQRQFALEHCTRPWVLWIDADEWPDPRLIGALTARLDRAAGGEPAAGFRIARHTWFLGRRIRFCGWQGERIVRLFRRERARFDDAPVHERVQIAGPIADLPGVLEHHSYPTVAVCAAKLVRYAHAGAARAWREGRRATVLDLALRPPLRFARQYLLQLGILDGVHGLLVCALAATQVLLKYAELWDRTRRPAASPPA